jgi:hypothetical protein
MTDLRDWLRVCPGRRCTGLEWHRPSYTISLYDEHRCTWHGRGPTIDDAFADAIRKQHAAAERAEAELDECDRVFAAGLERRVGA